MKDRLSEAYSKIISLIINKNSTYEDFLKIVKKSDYTRDHVYDKHMQSNKLVVVSAFLLKEYMEKEYSSSELSDDIKVEEIYRNNEIVKEKVKVLFHIIDNTPNLNNIENIYNYDLIQFIVCHTAFNVSVLKKVIDSGCDITKKYEDNYTLLQDYIEENPSFVSISKFKYILSLNKIDINNVNDSDHSLLSKICSRGIGVDGNQNLYLSSYKHIVLFDILINEPNIDVNAGCPLIRSLQSNKLFFGYPSNKNMYYVKKLIESPNLDINKKIHVYEDDGNMIDSKVDFFYLLISKSRHYSDNDNFKFLFNWVLSNNKIDVNKTYTNTSYPTLLSYFVATLNLYKSDLRGFDSNNDTNFLSQFKNEPIFKAFKDFIKYKNPIVRPIDIDLIADQSYLKDNIDIKIEFKKLVSTSINSILDSINE
jgi:hypothetical protein